MLCKKLCFLVLLFIVGDVFSQSNVDVVDITKLSIIAPAIGYEKRIGHLQTVEAEVFMSSAWGIGYSSSLGNTSFFYASPAVGLQYRYYYNAIRREEKGKRTAKNSMNYIAHCIA